jgi:hypothetical protein
MLHSFVLKSKSICNSRYVIRGRSRLQMIPGYVDRWRSSVSIRNSEHFIKFLILDLEARLESSQMNYFKIIDDILKIFTDIHKK